MSSTYTIGIDLGGTNLKIALVEASNRIKDKQVYDTRSYRNKESLINAITTACQNIIAKNKLNKNQISAIGLGLPGPINSKKGLVHFFPNIPGWKEVYLGKILKTRLKNDIYLDNDANLMALAEQREGAAKGFANAVCLTLGTGVGGGLILEGKLFRGTDFAAGEIGHIPLGISGEQCNCGGRACLERYIGNNRLLEKAKKSFGKNISLEELSQLSIKRNKKAIAFWQETGVYLGVVLSGVVNLLNPGIIVLGGGVANAGKILFDSVKNTIRQRAMPVQSENLRVVKAKLGRDAGMIGAGILAREKGKV